MILTVEFVLKTSNGFLITHNLGNSHVLAEGDIFYLGGIDRCRTLAARGVRNIAAPLLCQIIDELNLFPSPRHRVNLFGFELVVVLVGGLHVLS